MDEQIPDKKINQFRGWFNKVAVFAVALILTTAIITQGNFLEGLLKLLGVGASQLETISITSREHFSGASGEWLADFEGDGYNFPVFQGTASFDYFSGQPTDPNETGFVMPLWSGGGELTEKVTTTSVYTSPVIDLGLAQEILHSVDVLEYHPTESEIIYRYRVADSLSQLSSADYDIIELRTNSDDADFALKQALLGLPMHRYLQFQISFSNFFPSDRPMVAEFNISYGPEGGSETVDNPSGQDDTVSHQTQIAHQIVVDYNELSLTSSVDGSVRINTAVDGRLVTQQKDLDLSKLERVIIEDVELNMGEEYVIVLEAPAFDSKILYFSASYLPEDSYNFTFGVFYPANQNNTDISGDLNGDGVINSLDYAQFLELWKNFQNEGSL
jgi:hypothetical protein